MERWRVNPDWTGEEAVQEQRKWLDAQKPDGRARGPLEAWMSLQHIASFRNNYEDGDKGAVLDAISACALDDLPLPEWLAYAYLSAYRAVAYYRSKDWNSVFGEAHKKGTNLAAKRKRRELAPAIHNRAVDLIRCKPDTVIDAGFYEELAKEFNIGKSLAQEYIAWWSKRTNCFLVDVAKQARDNFQQQSARM